MKLSIIIINRDYIVICLKILRITWTEKPKYVTETESPFLTRGRVLALEKVTGVKLIKPHAGRSAQHRVTCVDRPNIT